MTVKRMDNVGIVVQDLDAAIEFFTELGLKFPTSTQQIRDLSGPISINDVWRKLFERRCWLRLILAS